MIRNLTAILTLLSGILAILGIATPTRLAAQTLPYQMVSTLFGAAQKITAVDGITFEIKIVHSDPKDKRPFKIFVEGPDGKNEIPIEKEGFFKLPPVPAADQPDTVLRHTLGKGDLTFSFILNLAGTLEKWDGIPLGENAKILADGFASIDPDVWQEIGRVIPQFANFRMAITGCVIPRNTPKKGRLLLKKGDQTVMTIPLSELGDVTIPFAKFDPATHRIELDGIPDGQKTKLSFTFAVGDEAERSPNAIQAIQAIKPAP
jgi:hypothetical protein